MEQQKLNESMIPPYKAALVEAEKARPPWKSTCTMSGSLWPLTQDGRLTRRWCWNTKRGWERASPRPAPMQRWRRSTGFSAFGALVTAASSHSKYKKIYCPEEKELTREEYVRLVKAAKEKSSERLALLLESICATGIRVSELPFITVEAVAQGEATVKCKGKTRTIFIPAVLCKKLRRYTQRKGIQTGPVFVTRTGKALNRSNVWREMKALCAEQMSRRARCFRIRCVTCSPGAFTP